MGKLDSGKAEGLSRQAACAEGGVEKADERGIVKGEHGTIALGFGCCRVLGLPLVSMRIASHERHRQLSEKLCFLGVVEGESGTRSR